MSRKWKTQLWKSGHARGSKQADASTYPLPSYVAGVQRPFDCRKQTFIVAGLLVISNQTQYLFSYWYANFFFFLLKSHQTQQLIQLSFQNVLEMRQQDSNCTDFHHLPWEASEVMHIIVALSCISLVKKDLFYDQAHLAKKTTS